MAGELGQQTVEPGAVVRRAAEESYLALRELVEKSRAEAQGKGEQQRSDTEKKIDLLKFIDRTPSGCSGSMSLPSGASRILLHRGKKCLLY